MYSENTASLWPQNINGTWHSIFWVLNVNDSYNHSYQLRNVNRVDHWIRKYKWWWSLLFLCHFLFIFNVYIIYKTLWEEVKLKLMSHYEYWSLVCLANIDPTNFGGRDNLVSMVQCRIIRKKYASTPTTTI